MKNFKKLDLKNFLGLLGVILAIIALVSNEVNTLYWAVLAVSLSVVSN